MSPVLCPRCSTPFDSVNAAANHLWKSQNDEHDDVETLDDGIREVVLSEGDGKIPSSETVGDGADSRSETGGNEVTDQSASEPATEAVADGGLKLDGPPETDAVDAVDDEPETEECPKCGSDSGKTRDELVRGKKYRCTDCETVLVWRP